MRGRLRGDLVSSIRFVVTGSGRCGTKWLSEALTAGGVPAAHEGAYNHEYAGHWRPGVRADVSWMAATHLSEIPDPIVLLVRHPLHVVRSWVEIGFFGWDSDNPTHAPLRRRFPAVYDYPDEHDRALAMWSTLTAATLRRAELVLRLEALGPAAMARLLGWAGAPYPRDGAQRAALVRPTNRHEESRARTGRTHAPSWDSHNRTLARRSRSLAAMLGYRY